MTPDTTPVKARLRAVILLSGGLDSTTCLAIARAEGRDCYALTVRYGQRHEHELSCARRVAKALGTVDHREVSVDLGTLGASALTSDHIAVPKDRDPTVGAAGIPPTYVPARNTVFLSIALAYAEVVDACEIWLGINAVDYSGYPDCRPEFLAAFQELAHLATAQGSEGSGAPRLRAPLVELSKADIIRRGLELGVDYAMTSTCYDPSGGGSPCKLCEACRLRAQGFAEANTRDPLES